MKVGIIIPYSIDRGWLQDAKESVMNQTYDNITLILSKSDSSVGHNINQGAIKLLEDGCDLIRYLCEDDELTLDSVERTVKHFQENPELDFVHGNAFTLNDKSMTYYSAPIEEPTLQEMTQLNRLHGGTVTYRADIFKEFQFDEELWTGEEYDFNLMLLHNNKKLGKIPFPLYIYRRHDKQKSLGNKDANYQASRQRQIQQIQTDTNESINCIITR